MLERGINKDVRALWQVCMRIKVSQGGRRSSWAGRWEAVCSDSCIWRGVGVGVRAARAPACQIKDSQGARMSMGMGTGIGVGNGYRYWYGCGYGCG